jgi:hypothetical protein
MNGKESWTRDGGCTCRTVRYRITRKPMFVHCCHCRIALWSHYGGAGDALSFVRVGSLDDPDSVTPDIHIFTRSKQPWIELLPSTLIVEAYYDRNEYWSAESLARRGAL